MLVLLYLAAVIALPIFGHAWHAGRPQQPSNVISLADAKARREQAKRVTDADRKAIHNGEGI